MSLARQYLSPPTSLFLLSGKKPKMRMIEEKMTKDKNLHQIAMKMFVAQQTHISNPNFRSITSMIHLVRKLQEYLET